MGGSSGGDGSRPRVLLLSAAANPELVSIHLEGWALARALAGVADIHLVTHVMNRDAIRRAGWVEGEDFSTIDAERVSRAAGKVASMLGGSSGKGWTAISAVSSLTYPYYEKLVWEAFRGRVEAGEFQVVHRHTPLSPTKPSWISGRVARLGIPMVFGPINGGLPWPRAFDRVRRQEREWLSYVRGLHKLQPGSRSTWRAASAILAGSINAWGQFEREHREKLVYVPENAVDPTRFGRRRARSATRPVRCVFVGRLVPYKGADMLLEAAAPLLRDGSLRVDVVGDGPQMPELRELAAREGIEGGVTFHGWVEHEKVADRLVESDLFTFPSIREFGGAVALEAMAVGLVPMVVAYGGPGELVTDETGYLIPLGDRASIVARLREALTGVVADPSRVDEKARAAVARVERLFTWEAKARQVEQVYRWVLGAGPKPVFPMPLE